MQKVNVKVARKNIAKLLNEVILGREIIILRRGRPVARLSKADSEKDPITFPSREEFRANFHLLVALQQN